MNYDPIEAANRSELANEGRDEIAALVGKKSAYYIFIRKQEVI